MKAAASSVAMIGISKAQPGKVARMICRIALPISTQGLRRAQDVNSNQRSSGTKSQRELRKNARTIEAAINARIAKKDRRLPFGEKAGANVVARVCDRSA